VTALLERRGFAAILAAASCRASRHRAFTTADVSHVRRSAFTAAIAIGALLRTTPYALLGHGPASGSTAPLAVAAASAMIGAAGATLLLRHAPAGARV
jgi:hypothetical protein